MKNPHYFIENQMGGPNPLAEMISRKPRAKLSTMCMPVLKLREKIIYRADYQLHYHPSWIGYKPKFLQFVYQC
jgi:hypothetical protein